MCGSILKGTGSSRSNLLHPIPPGPARTISIRRGSPILSAFLLVSWSDTGEAAAEAQASGRLAIFFRDLSAWLESEVPPRELATADRIREAAGMARDLARELKRLQDEESQHIDRRSGGDRDLRS